MIYTIEFELPDNETVIKNIKTARVSWSVWGYSGVTHAQPERKTGRWINGKCNQCGGHAPYWPMASTYYQSDFCQHCGSPMEVEHE